jgi:hypothetical protein
MAGGVSWLTVILGISRGILHDRTERRKFILWVILGLLGMFALGNWPMAAWLEEVPVRFLVWWGAAAMLAVFLFLLGLYDFLATLKELKSG